MVEEYQQAERTDGRKSYLERSLVLKKYLKDICYSKEEIRLEVRYDGASGRGTTPERAAGCPRTAGGERRESVILGGEKCEKNWAEIGCDGGKNKLRNLKYGSKIGL